jgi:hypothetical protein
MCLPLMAPNKAMLSAICEYKGRTAAERSGRTWDQRMHAVNGDELLGEGVGNALVVNTRTRYAANGFTSLRNASDCFGQSLTNDTPPVCTHANLEGRMSQDRWSPLDCVDLGHESTVDNACFVEDLITVNRQHALYTGHGCTYPVQLGWPLRILSQIALCSKANKVCSISTPSHQLSLNPVLGVPSSFRGMKRRSLPTSSMTSLP